MRKLTTKKKVKLKPLSLEEIEVAIMQHFGVRQHIIVPNISWGFNGMHECDLYIIKKSGYAVEVEIKRSIADLKKDFDKKHNHVDLQNRIIEFYYAIPEELYEKAKDLIPSTAGIIIICRWIDYKKQNRIRARIKQKAIRIKNARKLTLDEQFKVAILGCMRILRLKEKLIKLKK